MKNAIIVFLCVIVAWMGWHAIQGSKKEKVAYDLGTGKSGVALQAEEISRNVDSLGFERVVYRDAQPIVRMIEVQIEDKRRIDSLQSLLSIKDKELTGVSKFAGTMQAKALQLSQKIDEITSDTTYIYKDNYLDISFYRDPTSTTTYLSDAHYNFEFTNVSYDRTKWGLNKDFGKRISYTVISPSDTRATIRSFDKLTLAIPPDNYSAKLQATADYSTFNGTAGFGSNLNLRYKRMNLDGSYLFYPEVNRWYSAFKLSFDVVEL